MRTKLLGTTVLVLGLSLSACGGDAKDKKAGTSTVDLQLKYAKCMRDNGVDIPDPKADGSGSIILGVGGDAKTQAATDKCKQYLPHGGEPEKMSPEALAAMVKYAQCMRKNGIDMPDPTAGGGMPAQAVGSPADQAKMDKADKACKQFVPGAGG
jgi:hypothetical protein